MKFTIVIPTYNGADYVEEALLSAINQTRRADAIIVSDDNSTDNTLEICARYKEQISIYKNENGPSGFVEGWNNAIRLVADGYIAILHQDDLLAPTFLEEAELALRQHPDVKHFFVPCNYIDGDGKVIREPDYCDEEIHRYIKDDYVVKYTKIGSPHIHRCPGVITHRSIFDKCTYRKEAGHIADDDFFYRVGQYTDVVGLLKPLASYREHGKSETEHLGNLKLVTRLANDYLFQIEESMAKIDNNMILMDYFRVNAITFVFQQFVSSLKSNDKELINRSLQNKCRLMEMGVKLPFTKEFLYAAHRILGSCMMCKIMRFL